MRESSLWGWLRDGTSDCEWLHMHRVENSAEEGCPDVEGCGRPDALGVNPGRTFWCELKSLDRPKRPSTPVMRMPRHISPGQVNWLERRWSVGGSAWLLVGVGEGRARARYLIQGCLARRAVDATEVGLDAIGRRMASAIETVHHMMYGR